LLVDSHCHLNYLDDPEQALVAARARGVGGFLCIGVDKTGIDAVLNFAERHADVWATVGLHPDAAVDQDWSWIETHLDHNRVVAVGETGLDYFHSQAAEKQARQRESFDHQLHLAAGHDLPVVVHTRAAEKDTLALLRAHPEVRGVLHCFTESWDMARQALDLGYYISISGIVTFRNGANVAEVAARVPSDRLLVETDSPWLAPVPYRGQQNQPAYVVETAQFVAGLRGVDLETLAEVTSQNFRELFPSAQNSSSKSR
jgi:TatD DNase family protein